MRLVQQHTLDRCDSEPFTHLLLGHKITAFSLLLALISSRLPVRPETTMQRDVICTRK